MIQPGTERWLWNGALVTFDTSALPSGLFPVEMVITTDSGDAVLLTDCSQALALGDTLLYPGGRLTLVGFTTASGASEQDLCIAATSSSGNPECPLLQVSNGESVLDFFEHGIGRIAARPDNIVRGTAIDESDIAGAQAGDGTSDSDSALPASLSYLRKTIVIACTMAAVIITAILAIGAYRRRSMFSLHAGGLSLKDPGCNVDLDPAIDLNADLWNGLGVNDAYLSNPEHEPEPTRSTDRRSGPNAPGYDLID